MSGDVSHFIVAGDLTGTTSEKFDQSKMDSKSEDKSIRDSKLLKRQSYKAQRKNYRREKKRVAKELLSALENPSIIIQDDWLKIRGMLKGWTKLWCVLKPSVLLLYKSPKTEKSGHWVGTVLLNTCEVIERPSKKDGFCFKLFHPLEHSIWALRGPKGEAMGALVQPLPLSYLILRALSEPAGKCWMDAFELAMRCSSLLMRSFIKDQKRMDESSTSSKKADHSDKTLDIPEDELFPGSLETSQSFCADTSNLPILNDSDCEKHFEDHDLEDDNHTDRELTHSIKSSDSDSENPVGLSKLDESDVVNIETSYVESTIKEELGQPGDAGQTEEFAEEHKSLVWTLVKQIRPGMDLSKVVLPTFILEPRSFLDKLSDYHYHCDLLTRAVTEDDPYDRMKAIVLWYLSGFYKKPKGIKKPYNPILGETFRCFWKHKNSKTFYIAEQVSHHPPVSAFYVTNRAEGFCINGSILAKSKFYGNSLSAVLDGQARLTLLNRGEDYIITMPYAHCKGIVLGTLTMELGGKVKIECEKTGYRTDIDFKLKPFLAGNEQANVIHGKIKLCKEVLASIRGRWDGEIYLTDKRTDEEQLFWDPTPEIRASRLKRHVVPMHNQEEFESERLWQHVTEAIDNCDQVAATEEKTILEVAQRQACRERKVKLEEWKPRHFEQNPITGDWLYKYADSRPWDQRNDVFQYETDFIIKTKTRHHAPIVRSSSLVSINEILAVGKNASQKSCNVMRIPPAGRRLIRDSGSSDPEVLPVSDSSDSEVGPVVAISSKHRSKSISVAVLEQAMEPLQTMQNDVINKIDRMQQQINGLQNTQRSLLSTQSSQTLYIREFSTVIVILVLQWLFTKIMS